MICFGLILLKKSRGVYYGYNLSLIHILGVSESVMFKDFAGFRTLDSVVRANKVFQVPSFTIISQKFHCERALLIAKHYDIDAICFTAKQPEVYFGTRVREMFARVKAVLDLIIGVKPVSYTHLLNTIWTR